MYFDFEDYHPDTPTISRVISWREGVLLSIIVHLAAVIVMLVFPRLFPEDPAARAARLLAAQEARQEERPTFVFVQPKLDRPAPKAPPRAELSDLDRHAQSPKRVERPENPLPYSRGNSPERVEAMREEASRGRGAQPDATPPPPEPPAGSSAAVPESDS